MAQATFIQEQHNSTMENRKPEPTKSKGSVRPSLVSIHKVHKFRQVCNPTTRSAYSRMSK